MRNEKNGVNIWVGIDVGAVSVNVVINKGEGFEYFDSRRLFGSPLDTTLAILENIRKKYGLIPEKNISVTGSAGKRIAEHLNALYVNEFQAVTLAVCFLYPDIRTIFEIGGQTSKYILLDANGIVDYGVNGDCAAGTGSFIDQQAGRLRYSIEEVGKIAMNAKKSARIAGRCSVFAKSDMIHAQQMGYNPAEVLKGLCIAVGRNYKSTIVRGRRVEKPVLLIGGIALNIGMIDAIIDVFELSEKELIVPKNPEYIGACGASMYAKTASDKHSNTNNLLMAINPGDKDFFCQEALDTGNVLFLRDKVSDYEFPKDGKVNVYLGLDVGSVSTNVVVITEDGKLVYDIYTKTKARPIEVVTECLKEVDKKIGRKIEVKGVGTTGSGRELIGELIGADIIKDEITAHKTGAIHLSQTMIDGQVDTIFEIGGQDAKFISIENGVVVDFTMNEACAAGTGSFLEEQAEKLGIKIKDEFASLALSSKSPIKLGERCTVFMERDVDAECARGSKLADIVAGLSYSVVLNYLNRVVRGRKLGDTIFFQGGTAYNNAVAAAFAKVTGKKIVVPPYNGVIGAIGASLLSRSMINEKRSTTFKGFDISKVNYSIREFTCKACTNECEVQEFTVDGAKTYWGDKCSSRYRKKTKVQKKPILKDLIKEREKLLFESYEEGGNGPTIGIPRAMYFYDRFPFWQAYLRGLGFNVVVSEETNKTIVSQGIAARVAEPCHPIGVAHGHIQDLINKGADYIWLPNVLTAEPNGQEHVRPYLCPWGMTLPFVAKASPRFEPYKMRFITPTLHYLHGDSFLSKQLYGFAKPFGIKKSVHKKAFNRAVQVQNKFRKDLITLGEMALHKLEETTSNAVVLIGRPYNLFDLHVNLNVPTKIRNNYGVDVIPLDMLPVVERNIEDVADHMFWNYGKKILERAKFIGEHKNLHMIYITNFKCGPDSFIKHFARNAAGKPFLTLQFDEHSNDAGIMTRIEAYLDSKGLLRQKKDHVNESQRVILKRSATSDKQLATSN